MNPVENYIHEVLRNIQAPADKKQRIEADLRSHFQAAVEAGEPLPDVMNRMGSPEEVAAAFMGQEAFSYGSFGCRLAAFMIDMLVIFAAGGVLALIAVAMANLVPREPAGLGYVVGAFLILLVVGSAAGAVGMILFYFPILEGRFGQTPGKLILRLRVLKENGLPIGYKEAFLRRLSYYFEFLPVDALFILFNPRRQRAMDIVARTIVIKESPSA
jgi:uncharacterized RDD family membrane protein YckC